MPSMPKPDPDLLQRMEGLLAALPARKRLMFGTAAWFADSNAQMFAGVWGDRVNMRVGKNAVTELVDSGGADPIETGPRRPVEGDRPPPPPSVSDDAGLRSWIERGLEFAESLPPKRKRR
ncbi:MAG: hypothetical protein OXG11_03775 [Chloroflexi bacterium]|nr:hypothetical protein [Chloroflexota bacterium]